MKNKRCEICTESTVTFLLLWFLVSPSEMVAQENWEPQSALAKVASTDADFVGAVDEFYRLEPCQLEQLSSHRNLTISIYAKWISIYLKSKRIDNGGITYVLSKKDLGDFSTHLSKVLNSAPPEWWTKQILSSELVNGEIQFENVHPAIHLESTERVWSSHELQITSLAPMFAGKTALGKTFSLDEVNLPDPLTEEDFECLVDVILASESEAIVVASDVIGWGAEIVSVDLANNKRNWKNRVDGITSFLNISGPSGPEPMDMYFETSVTEKLVIVWGTHCAGFYCEGFDRTSGQRLVRFSSRN